jgi:hypothetical protein
MTTNETQRALPTITDDDFARDELHAVEPQFVAIVRALEELATALGELQGWRTRLVLDVVTVAHEVLTCGGRDAWDLPALPADYLVWRQRYWNDACPL